jgi:predicted metal-dependent hydrolase
MPESLNIMWSNGRSEALEAGLPLPLEIRSVRGARRLRLRFDDRSATLKLTCPPRTSRRAAVAWVLDQRDWIDAQVARALPAEPFVPGGLIPIEGEDVRLVWAEGEPRTPRLAMGELRCGGPPGGFARRIERFLKARALDVMTAEAKDYAALAGAAVASVSIGDAATRWGSCSSAGSIRLSWRLILMPPNARRFVVAHEVAHLRHLNHGPEFKALEALLFGTGLAEAKTALRRLGPRVRRVGRGG